MSPNVVPTSPAQPHSANTCSDSENILRIKELLAQFNCYKLNYDAPWLERVLAAYQQPHRHFHTLEHLRSICELTIRRKSIGKRIASQLLLTALFHDVVWFPAKNNNETQSAAVFDLLRPSFGNTLPDEVAQSVRDTVIATKTQQDLTPTAMLFHEFDCDVLLNGTPVDLLAYEFQIFREFQSLSAAEYRKGREAFFNRFSKRFPAARQNMHFLVEYLERRRPRIGIYAGTFNPFHIGHFSILQKAERMFDKVVVAVGLNPAKTHHDGDAVVEQVRHALPFHEVIFFNTLMVDLLDKATEHADVTLVRGLRNGYDLDYEMSQQRFMQEMRPNTHSVYIPCDKSYEHISSSALRGLRIFDCHGKDKIYFPNNFEYYYATINDLFGQG